jgi:hypothetical protein
MQPMNASDIGKSITTQFSTVEMLDDDFCDEALDRIGG